MAPQKAKPYADLARLGQVVFDDKVVQLQLVDTGEELPDGTPIYSLSVGGSGGAAAGGYISFSMIDDVASSLTEFATGEIKDLFDKDNSTTINGDGNTDKTVDIAFKYPFVIHHIEVAAPISGNKFSNTKITVNHADGTTTDVLDESADNTVKSAVKTSFDPILAIGITIVFAQNGSGNTLCEVGNVNILATNLIVIQGGAALIPDAGGEGENAYRQRKVYETLEVFEEDIDVTSVELDTTTNFGVDGPWEAESILIHFTNAFVKDVTVMAENTATGKTTLIKKWTASAGQDYAVIGSIALAEGWEIYVDSANKVTPAGTADVAILGKQRMI